MSGKAADSIAPVTLIDSSGTPTANTCTLTATITGSAQRAALPAGFNGSFIRVRPVGAAVRWTLFVVPAGGTVPAAASILVAPTPADPPTNNTTTGSYVPDGIEVEREAPYVAPGGTLYIAWLGSAAGTFLQIEKGSGKPGVVAEP
jgi:hypothetical protein